MDDGHSIATGAIESSKTVKDDFVAHHYAFPYLAVN